MRKNVEGPLLCGSVAECLENRHKALGSVLSIGKTESVCTHAIISNSQQIASFTTQSKISHKHVSVSTLEVLKYHLHKKTLLKATLFL